MKLQRKRERAIALLVVVAVLAALSLLIATFAMVMSVESAAVRNQTEYEMARQAAHAGLDHVLSSLRTNPGLANSDMYSVCPDPDNCFFCRETARRDGVKAGYLIHSARSGAQHAVLAGKSWAGGDTDAYIGPQPTGVFDLNGFGFAADSDCYMTRGIRYASSQASLYQVLDAVFRTMDANRPDPPPPPATNENITKYIPRFYSDPEVRKYVAALLSQAITSYRYGADGVPGSLGREDHHPDHLPNWYCSTPNLWPSFGDTGASVSGLFWGKVDSGSSVTQVKVDTSVRNWRDWPADRWKNCYVYFATGWSKAAEHTYIMAEPYCQFLISGSGTNTLNLANALSAVPQKGDYFCILPAATNYADYKIGRGDTIPTCALWPFSACDVPAGELYVWPLNYLFHPAGAANLLAEGTTAGVPAADQVIISGAALPASWPLWLNAASHGYYSIRILDGAARGQVRHILSSDNTNGLTLTLNAPWTNSPANGSRFRIEHDASPVGVYLVDGRGNPDATNAYAWLRVLGATSFFTNQLSGCVVTIYEDTSNPAAVGQSRLVAHNTGNTIYLSRAWNSLPTAGTAKFRIELPQDYKFAPDHLQGDDRTYKSVAEVLDVMSDALENAGGAFWDSGRLVSGNVTSADAAAAAAILYSTGYTGDADHPPLKDVLTIGNNMIGMKQQYVSINDWASDGIDNDDNGIIDDAGEATYEDTDANKSAKLAKELYTRLGLKEWVYNADPASDPADTRTSRLRQAAQLVANIIDFRDTDDRPTHLTIDNISADATLGAGEFAPPVNGYEGVHITEIMCAPAAITRPGTPALFRPAPDDGCELVHDGYVAVPAPNDPMGPLNDTSAWDYIKGTQQWQLMSPGLPPASPSPVMGTWEFDMGTYTTLYGFKRGWYAIRIHGTASTTYQFSYTMPDAVTVYNGSAATDATGWGYVRITSTVPAAVPDPANKLLAVNIGSTDKLTFKVGHTEVGKVFDGFQLLPQFVEVTNCAAHDVNLDSLEIIGASSQLITFPVTPGCKIDGATVVKNGATAFPPRYGTFVIALSEEAYARNYGTAATNGVWNNVGGEDHYVLFVGDRWGSEAADTNANARAEIFRFGNAAAPTIPDLKLRSNADIVAATGTGLTDYDGNPNDATLSAPIAYQSREKAVSPFAASWTNYDTAAAATLGASQNRSYGAGIYSRTCLNRNYDACWNGGAAGYPALFTTAGGFAATVSRVYPVILNRPYPSPGWLGLVPTGNLPWRTIDSNPTPGTPATGPKVAENLLGLFLSRAIVGGVHSRINLNKSATTHTRHALCSILNSATDAPALWGVCPTGGWGSSYTSVTDWYHRFVGWEELLNHATVRGISTTSTPGAGTIQPAAFDDPDQNEEFVRRYSNLIDLRAANLKYVVAGLVYENGASNAGADAPIAQVRIEVEIDLSGPAKVVQFRYLTE